MERSGTALALLERFLEAYLVERDIAKAVSCLSREISWFGTSDNEDIHGLEEARLYMEREIESSCAPYQVEYISSNDQTMPDGSGAAQVKCSVTGSGVVMRCRCSAAVCMEDGQPRLLSLHMSVPDTVQQSGEYFPFSLAEQYKKELHDDFLDELIDGGVLGRYYEPSTEIYVVNRQLLDFLGYPSEEVFRAELQNNASNTIFPEDREAVFTSLAEQLANGSCYRLEYRMLHRDGTPVWVETHGKLVVTKEGRTALVGVVNDITARKETEKRLLESDERYRVAVDGAGVNVWDYDFARRCIIQSDGSMKRHGFDRVVENVPQSLVDCGYVWPEDQAAFLEMYQKMERGESPVSGDFWVTSNNQKGRWCERIYYSVICDDAGKPVKAYGASQDVTAFKIAEKRYKEEISYRSRLSESVIAACCVNLTRRYVEEMRVGTGESIADQHRDAIDYEDRVRVFAYDLTLTDRQKQDLSPQGLEERYERGEDTYETEFAAQLTKGNFIWVRCRVNVLRRPDTNELVAFFYNEDVTQEKTLAGIVDGVVKTEYEFVGRIDVNSGRYTAVFGENCESPFPVQTDYESELKRRSSVCADTDKAGKIFHDLSVENIVRELESKPVFTYETDEKDKNGVPRRKQLHYFYLNKEAGFILSTGTDVDDIVKKEQQKQEALERAIHAKTEFLSRMSHDMRTPMNAIIGLSSLAMDTEASDETRDYLEKINVSGKYLLGLINDTLDMSRIESDKLILNPEPYPGREFAETLRNLLCPKAESKGVALIVDKAFDSAPTLMVDKLRFAQIFVNLGNNAVKFTPKGGSVSISLEYFNDRDGVQSFSIAVKDSGIGISREFQKKMYDSFEQEQRDQPCDEVGTGLGLSIVKRLVDVMHGTISCDSAPDMGTTFHVAFSAHFIEKQSCQAEAPHNAVDLSLLAGKRILLAEDHPLNVQVAVKLLEKQKLLVETAQNGLLAVKLFEGAPQGHFDAILMDIRMPVMDGLTSAKTIRSLARPDAASVPIIAMSANAFDEDMEKSRAAGMNAHLSKPIEPERLYETLCRFVRR